MLLDIVFLAVVLNNDKFCFSLLDNASVCIVLPPPPSLPPSLPPAPPLPLSPPAAPPAPPTISQEVIALLVDHLPSVSAYPGLMRWLVFAAAALFFFWFVASDGLSALVSWLTELHRVVGTDSWASAPEWRLFTLLILTLVENLATIRYLDERFDPVYPFLAFNAQAMVASATQVQRIGTMLSNSQAQAHVHIPANDRRQSQGKPRRNGTTLRSSSSQRPRLPCCTSSSAAARHLPAESSSASGEGRLASLLGD